MTRERFGQRPRGQSAQGQQGATGAVPWTAWAALVALAACGPDAGEACPRYLSCFAAYQAAFDVPAADLSDYEADGRCWQRPQNRARCEALCAAGLEELREASRGAGEDLPACQ